MTRRVFFVGAGFSKALNSNYPTLFELSATVATTFKKRYPAGAIREHFDQLPPNLGVNAEHLLSYLISDWPWKSSVERDLDRALYKAFIYEISKALSTIEDQPLALHFQELIQFLFVDEGNTIVSLNYDYLPQKLNALYSRPTEVFPFPGVNLKIEYRYEKGRRTSHEIPWVAETLEVPIYKTNKMLIVSREWLSTVTPNEFTEVATKAGYVRPPEDPRGFMFDFSPEPATSLPFFQTPRPNPGATPWSPSTGKVMHLHGSMLWRDESGASTIRITDADGYTHSEQIPAIVPPVLDKSQHYAAGRLRAQWEAAHNAIQRAEEIVVIGFSFPPTDMSCQFLFKSATKAGVRVVVVNRDPKVRDIYGPVFEGVPGVTVDYTFTGGEDPLARYTKAEILRIPPEL